MPANYRDRSAPRRSRGTLKTFDDCMDLPSRFKLLLGISKIVEIGELACQKIIHTCINKERVQSVVTGALLVERNEVGFFNPLLDIASARHELAFSRLFIS